MPFYGDRAVDGGDVFEVKNTLADGQSEADVSRVSAIKGDGGLTNGVHGVNDGGTGHLPGAGIGVWGESNNGLGVFGSSNAADGVRGMSTRNGVHGINIPTETVGSIARAPGNSGSGRAPDAGVGVWGESYAGIGVFGSSGAVDGVQGISRRNGVHGISDGPGDSGVWGEHRAGGYGVSGSTNAGDDRAGVWGSNGGRGHGVKGTSVQGAAIYGETFGGGPAGYFKGNVVVTGDITLPSGDLAEDFALAGSRELAPGTVVVLIDDESIDASSREYDRRVAGVVAGAGAYRPAIVLNRTGAKRPNHATLALVGRACCFVDASFGAIEIGDLLVTSSTPGHAMKGADPSRSFGAVIGKALRPLASGRALIPILIALQ